MTDQRTVMESVHANIGDTAKYTICYSIITNENPPIQAEVRYLADSLMDLGYLRDLARKTLSDHAEAEGMSGKLAQWPLWMSDAENRGFIPLDVKP